VDSIVVRWPSGVIDHIDGRNADQELIIEEGKGLVPHVTPSEKASTGLVANPKKHPKF
jgi:hypothetical protein